MLQSTTYTGAGTFTFNVPALTTMVWSSGQAPGGGGDASFQFQDSKGAGGAGEFWNMVPLPVTGGGTLSVVIGAAGSGAIASGASATDGGSISFGPYTFLGGLHCPNTAGATPGGNGGGPGGGLANSGVGQGHVGGRGKREAPTVFGGAGGGAGGAQDGSKTGQIGQYLTIQGASAPSPHVDGGGAGGPAVLGPGGAGASGGATPIAPTGYGGGGGGASQSSVAGIGQNGAGGAPGIVMLFYT